MPASLGQLLFAHAAHRQPLETAAPLDRRRPGEVAGVRERRHHHVTLLELAIGDGAVEVDRDARGEEVAAFVDGVAVALPRYLQRFAPVSRRNTQLGWFGDT
jgi:hypothetical protein